MARHPTPDERNEIYRLWCESGWVEADNATHRKGFEALQTACVGAVAELNGQVEAHAQRASGTLRFMDRDLPLCHIASVNVGRLARRRGLGRDVVAHLLEEGRDEGQTLAILGMFDQGYYDKLGFGTASYQRSRTFDPAALDVPELVRVPRRLGLDDAEWMHECRRTRLRRHGSTFIEGSGVSLGEMCFAEDELVAFGFDEGHHAVLSAKGEHGPYSVLWLNYSTRAQLIELFSVFASWRDQVHGIRCFDPPHLEIQDLLQRPFAEYRARKRGPFAQEPRAFAWWQVRILDLPQAIEALSVPEALDFQLELTDPLGLVTGCWDVYLGDRSHAEPGRSALPRVEASVGAFTRWWLGVRRAADLAATDDLAGSAGLLARLDSVQAPRPELDWDL